MTNGISYRPVHFGLVFVLLIGLEVPGRANSQGIGLPGRAGDKPLEITAEKGIEWQQKAKAYIARGNARAVQGNVSVYADTLTAHYRERPDGHTQIWRIAAEKKVRIITPTQRAYGDKGVYNVDSGVLVLTGNVRLDTDNDRITARDSLEYWEKRGLAVARGDAIAIRGDNRLRADVLRAHFEKDEKGKASVRFVDAIDNVVITTPDEIVRSNRGKYDVKTGIARLTGSVRITRGNNQLNGANAEINLNTGVSKLFGDGKGGVRGIFMNEKSPLLRGGAKTKSRGAR
ncbi:MAG: LptA/OstA family protein [Pseudomonadota bacterium]|nr:LptA/OstA family protein [Pseudomonadota bacterium]